MAELSSKPRILIADDSEMNRAILTDMLEDEYDIIEAENGIQAVAALEEHGPTLSLVLLDIIMPEMDGFGVLTIMNERGWIQDIPVIMISSESRSDAIERAYSLGITDYINRPFDASIVHHRVVNTILLYAKQKKLIALVEEQVRENTKQSTMMIDILSHIVEFRNGESGLHVIHIRTLTELFLRHLDQVSDQFSFSQQEISLISTASALHDIGKIAIPGSILNKPGKLTAEEFAVMKTHTTVGAAILDGLVAYRDAPLVKAAYEIARWHHERYDGRGYPDGLKGDEIPIPAQIVALADVYDALTSERVYKPPFPHEKAISMILNGECGTFSPLLMQCLEQLSDVIRDSFAATANMEESPEMLQNIATEMIKQEELSASEGARELLAKERKKGELLAAMSGEIQFEYTADPPSLSLSQLGMERFGLPQIVSDPLSDPRVAPLLPDPVYGIKLLAELRQAIITHHPQGVVEETFILPYPTGPRWTRLTCQGVWGPDDKFSGLVGKLTDIHEEKIHVDNLERLASLDPLTGLLNRARGQSIIQKRLAARPDQNFAFAIADLDGFKEANDIYGHQFGDKVLVETARYLRSIAGEDAVVSRFGGDEFIIFAACGELTKADMGTQSHPTIQCDGLPFTLSVGIALTKDVGSDYDTLFRCADRALYFIKRSDKKDQVSLYDPSMRDMFEKEESK